MIATSFTSLFLFIALPIDLLNVKCGKDKRSVSLTDFQISVIFVLFNILKPLYKQKCSKISSMIK